MESFIVVNANAKNTNIFCVVGMCVTKYGSNNGMDGLKEKNLFKLSIDDEVGANTDDLLLQETFLDSLKKNN
jgi:hypothetical protein